jgi:hypothetical protein
MKGGKIIIKTFCGLKNIYFKFKFFYIFYFVEFIEK